MAKTTDQIIQYFGSGFGQLSGLAGEKFGTVYCNFVKSVCDQAAGYFRTFLVFSLDSVILLDERDFATLSSLELSRIFIAL